MKAPRASSEWMKAFRAANPVCHYCVFHPTHGRDHKLAAVNGGTNGKENILPSCLMCNMLKGSKNYEWFLFFFRRFLELNRPEYEAANSIDMKDIKKWQRKFSKWSDRQMKLYETTKRTT